MHRLSVLLATAFDFELQKTYILIEVGQKLSET